MSDLKDKEILENGWEWYSKNKSIIDKEVMKLRKKSKEGKVIISAKRPNIKNVKRPDVWTYENWNWYLTKIGY